MKTILHILTLFIVVLSLTGCDGEEQPVPRKKLPVIYNENPIVAYCGVDCGRCHHNSEECLRLLQENLPTLCDNLKQNCYDLWTHYADRCRRVCSGR